MDFFHKYCRLLDENAHFADIHDLLIKNRHYINYTFFNSAMGSQGLLITKAVSAGRVDVVRYLADFNPEYLVSEIGIYPSPIHLAVYNSDVEMVRFILQYNSKVRFTKDSLGLYPIFNAIRVGSSGVLSELLHFPGQLELRNSLGQTPLHYAITFGDMISGKIVQILCEKGADFKIRDSNGNTPFMSAVLWDNYNAVKILTPMCGGEINDVGTTTGESPAMVVARRKPTLTRLKIFRHLTAYGGHAIEIMSPEQMTRWRDFITLCTQEVATSDGGC